MANSGRVGPQVWICPLHEQTMLAFKTGIAVTLLTSEQQESALLGTPCLEEQAQFMLVSHSKKCLYCWQCGMLLLVHGEVTDSHVDMFDREKVFIEQKLKPLRRKLPQLRIVMEHITTKDAVDFVASSPQNVAATITPQHITLNRNALFQARPFSTSHRNWTTLTGRKGVSEDAPD